ncbi:MAG: hypothetical protein IKX05_01560 [Bacteroidales bacterium]|nr:hypothetical protein [Bacteroidales bacterium]
MARFANILFDDTFKVVVCAPENEQLLIKIIELLIPGKHIKTLVLKDKVIAEKAYARAEGLHC